MAESLKRTYQRLFEVQLFHHYWLDDGGTSFDLIADIRKKDRIRREYDVRSFFQITPTIATQKALKGFGALYKETATGFFVATSNTTAISSDTVFEFFMTVQDPAFFNYTALTLRQRKIYEGYCFPDNTIHRYKENVPVFSNLTGATHGSGSKKQLFLSKAIPGLKVDDAVESFFIESDDLWQLTTDQPNAGRQKLNTADKLPVFANQADVSVPEALPHCFNSIKSLVANDKPLFAGIQLSDDIPNNVFALIRLSATRSDDGDFSFIEKVTDVDGNVTVRAKLSPPVYQIHFKNRSTWWKYIDRSGTGTFSASPLPMTYYGNAYSSNKKPSTELVKVEKEQNTTITKLVSEIFI
jgi:hypothetical protein